MNTSSANMPESRSVLLDELQPFNAQTAHTNRKPPRRETEVEPLLTADDVAKRLNVSTDWVWDHSSRKKPLTAGNPHGGRNLALSPGCRRGVHR